jgi:hypothetical protein
MHFIRGLSVFAMLMALSAPALFAGADDPPGITEDYEISFGSQWGAIPGDPAFFLPITVSFLQPTVRMNLILTYDPTCLVPTLLAPNIFVQSFDYDLSQTGKIRIEIITDLPPPPDIPPIQGDTTVAWISFVVTSRFIGYNFLTHVDYYEDPNTLYPDNFIVLEDNSIITPPNLLLVPGDVLILLPLYGDINLNTFPWEIGDAVTFLNFFMGAPFNRQQYANADCNRDGVQASISDLVYLLRVISYDSLLVNPPDQWPAFPSGEIKGPVALLNGTSVNSGLLSHSDQRCDIVFDAARPIGGAAFIIDLANNKAIPDEITLHSGAGGMYLFYSIDDDLLRIAVVDWTGDAELRQNGPLVSIRYSGDGPLELVSADFSDKFGQPVDASASMACSIRQIQEDAQALSLELSGFPNPFNSVARIHLTLPADGRYKLAAYDIMGRKVKTFFDETRQAGSSEITWDGADDQNTDIASGTYFIRLQGDGISSTLKMNLLK